MNEGQEAKQWLRQITKDQNLNQLDDITLTRWDTLKRWFQSRILQPTIITGYYDATSGFPVLGQFNPPPQLATARVDRQQQNSAVSAASSTLTCAAGYAYYVEAATLSNSNRAFTPQLTVTPSGGAASSLIKNTGTTAAAGVAFPVIGGTYAGGVNTTMSWHGDCGIWLFPGDVLTLTDVAFVAADVMAHQFVFTRYVL